MGRRAELIIERRYADPQDPDYERDLEIVADALLRLINSKTIINQRGSDGNAARSTQGGWIEQRTGRF